MALHSLPYIQHLSSPHVYFVPEDGGSSFLRNVGKNLQVYRVSFQKTAIVSHHRGNPKPLNNSYSWCEYFGRTHIERLISKETFVSWQHWLPPLPTLTGRVL